VIKTVFSRLTRITSSGLFIPQIDGLRFIAIFLVVTYHLNGKLAQHTVTGPISGYFDRIIANGFQGVELFFVISGFILGLPFAKYYRAHGKKVILKQYFMRRLTRLEPPFIVITILFFIGYLTFDASYSFKREAGHFFSSLTYLHNLYTSTGFWRMNGVTWSLEIEVQFYILAPVLALLFKNDNMYVRRILILSAIFVLILFNSYVFFDFRSIAGYLQFFLAGFFLVDLYLSVEELKVNRYLSFFIGSALLFVILTIPYHESLVSECGFVASIIVFYFLVLKNDFWKQIFSLPILTSIGGMCYTIYMIHFPIMGALVKLSSKIFHSDNYLLDLFVHAFIVLPVLLLCSSIVFLLLEKPCMNKEWPKILFRKIRSPQNPCVKMWSWLTERPSGL